MLSLMNNNELGNACEHQESLLSWLEIMLSALQPAGPTKSAILGREQAAGGRVGWSPDGDHILPSHCSYRLQKKNRTSTKACVFTFSSPPAGREQMGVIYAHTLPQQPWHSAEGCKGRVPPRLRKLLSAPRQESHSRASG